MSLFDKEELRRLLSDTKSELMDEGHSERSAERLTRREYIKWLTGFTEDLLETIRSNATLPVDQRDERLIRQRADFHFFRTTYFPHYYYLPGKSELQEHLEAVYHRICDKRLTASVDIPLANGGGTLVGEKFAIAAPRGHGKSTDVSVVFVIWCIVNDLKHFITIFSDAIELTETLIEAIKAELTENDNLKADFPNSTGIGRVWRVGDIVTRNGIRIKGFGSGKRVRGIKHGVWRPDLSIIDDLENDENVRSQDQRDKLESWLDEAVANLGAVDGTMDILYIGTVLHRDSVLARKLKMAFWNPKIFRAIITFPERMDLWDQYALIYLRRGLQEAHDFYLANKPDMDKGARVLWPDAVPTETLMRKRAESPRSFSKELQNNPSSETQKFKRERMHFYRSLPPLKQLKIYGWCDPAGNGKKSDFTSITIFGVDERAMMGYVIESYNEVIGSLDIVRKIVDFQERYRCDVFGVETNGGQFHLKAFILKEAFERGVHMPLRGVHNSDNKVLRIEELELPIENAQILMHEDQVTLIDQLEEFPEGKNDDAPDSLVCVYRLSKLAKKQKLSAPRKNRRSAGRVSRRRLS
ncbi:MAG: phage terminase large subunit [Sulfuricurvum sp.]|nr:phage terminase large subunit [Sulfuricurvum sp.]